MALSLLCAALLTQAPAKIEWKTIFTGKPEFEHCTRVFATSKGVVFFDSPAITHDDGGDVYLLKDGADKPAKVFSVEEQGAHRIIRIGKNLLIPGTDAEEDWSLGNYYVSEDEGETWKKVRNIPGGIHVFDLCAWKGRWYAGFAQSGGAAVYSSADEGKTWEVSLQYKPKDSFGEALMVLPLKDGLYAHTVEKWGTVENGIDFHRFDGKEWKPMKLFKDGGPCWNYRLDKGAAWLGQGSHPYYLSDGKAKPIPSLDGVSVTDYEFLASKLILAIGKPSGQSFSSLYLARRSKLPEESLFKKVADLPEGCRGNSLAVHRGVLYIACYAPKGGKVLSAPLKTVLGLRQQ